MIRKVRQIRNNFFKPTFNPKNERTNATLLLVDLFSFVFGKKVKTPKKDISKLTDLYYWKINCLSGFSKPQRLKVAKPTNNFLTLGIKHTEDIMILQRKTNNCILAIKICRFAATMS